MLDSTSNLYGESGACFTGMGEILLQQGATTNAVLQLDHVRDPLREFRSLP